MSKQARALQAALMGGVVGILVAAGIVVQGCGNSDNGNNSNTSSSSGTSYTSTTTTSSTSGTTTSTTTSTTTGTSSSSAGEGGVTDAGDAGSSCALPGTVLFAFDDGGTGGWMLSSPTSDPADAGFVPALSYATPGNTCPGSLQISLPFSTLGQKGGAAFPVPYPGMFTNASAVHFSIRAIIPSDTDGSAVPWNVLVGPANGAYGNLQPFAQYSYATADGAIPTTADGSVITYQQGNYNVNVSISGFMDGGWQAVTVPITLGDSGAPGVYLNAIAVQAYDPAVTDAGPAALSQPVTLVLQVDDVYLQ